MDAMLHFLVFEVQGQPFGVNVDDVEVLVEGGDGEGTWQYEGQDIPVQNFSAWIGLGPPSSAPSRVFVSRCGGALRGFLVDTPRDIVALPVDEIFAMPDLIRRVLGATPIWGVGRHAGGLLLLVDLAPAQGDLASQSSVDLS